MAEKRESSEEFAQYDRRSSTKGLAGRYFERLKPRNHDSVAEYIKKSQREGLKGMAAFSHRDAASLDRFQNHPE